MVQLGRLFIFVGSTLATLAMSSDDTFDTRCAENCQSAVLCGFRHSEENEPQHPFGGCADRQQHLGERDDVAGDTQCQDYCTRTGR